MINFLHRKYDKEQIKLMLQERLIVTHDVSSVFRSLHQQRIVYRDIKSQNIGFDIRVRQEVASFATLVQNQLN